ncbi:hypothetical protein ACQEVF_40155 [Nonomuraea polychroma]|uniref:hypothetical protein n=1 Tax=Nonomuraea polychroma TaxID=46176 RepID=UPI003D908A44
MVSGLGVTVAAETALGGLDGRTLSVEGFGKVGGAVVREAARRGACIVAFSTLHGCVARSDPPGWTSPRRRATHRTWRRQRGPPRAGYRTSRMVGAVRAHRADRCDQRWAAQPGRPYNDPGHSNNGTSTADVTYITSVGSRVPTFLTSGLDQRSYCPAESGTNSKYRTSDAPIIDPARLVDQIPY